MDHILPIDRTRPRPEIAPVVPPRRPRRDEDRDEQRRDGGQPGDEQPGGERRRPAEPGGDGRLDVLA